MIITRSAFRRPLALAPIAALSCALLLLAGCGSDTSTASPATQPSAGSPSTSGGGGAGRGGFGEGDNDPGRISGEIAAIDGKTLQIQDGESQTAVTYSAKTTFAAQVKGTVSDIETGECVTVITASTDEDATEITATSVTASAATDGQCGFGFGAGARGGTRPSGTPSGQPSAGGPTPSGFPSGMPNGGARPRSGTVTAIDGDTLTVAATRPGSDTTTKITVKTTGDTVVTVTETSKASAAEVGMCATANGKADDTGAVAATRITLREAGDDGCTVRRGNRREPTR